MSRDDTYLVDILESARIAMEYVAGKFQAGSAEKIETLYQIVRGRSYFVSGNRL